MRPWSRTAKGGLELRVRLTPRGGLNAVGRVEMRSDDRVVLAVRVTEAPENGKANAALLKVLAKFLGVPSSSLALVAGHTGRLKTISVKGDPADMESRLERALMKDCT